MHTQDLLRRYGFNPFSERSLTLLVVGFAVVFFCFTTFFSFTHNRSFSSPDETANHFFTKQFIETGKLSAPADGPLASLIKPRSVGWQENQLIPSSFIGLPLLYGAVGKVFGGWSIYFFEPLLASVAVFLFYLTLKRIFSPSIAAASAVLLCTQPVFVFYAMRPFWHNGLFIELIIIAGALLLRSFASPRWWSYGLFGFTLSLALAVRSAEIAWVALSVLLIALVYRQKISWRYVGFAACGAVCVFVPLLLFQFQTFDSVLPTSYHAVVSLTSDEATPVQQSAQLLGRLLIPFGFDPMTFFNTFFRYSLQLMFPWFTIGLFGAIQYIVRQFRAGTGSYAYAVWVILLSIWLMVYYGSFTFTEFVDPSAVLIGNSYARYWLPLYVLIIPFTVSFLFSLARRLLPRQPRLMAAALLIVLTGIGIQQIVNDRHFGMSNMEQSYFQPAERKLETILKNTPTDAIILAGPDDKIYWPKRRVVGYNGSSLPASIKRQLPQLFAVAPVYYQSVDAADASNLNDFISEYEIYFQQIDEVSGIYRLTDL